MPSTMPSLRTFAGYALGVAQVAIFSQSEGVLGGTPLTCTNPLLSCSATTPPTDTCCYNSPGGLLLQTQFWDAKPSTGPSNSWTIHGLWPDHCDGTFDAFCDKSRELTNITDVITAAGQPNLLNFMQTFWKDGGGNDESFWEHEWNKHGTCISTLTPSCYNNYTPQEDVVDFFNRTVELFKTLPSFDFLSAAGIVPSDTATYNSADIIAALSATRGVSPTIRCTKGELNEVWYYYNVAGSVVDGSFQPSQPDKAGSNCPASGVKYSPKSGSPAPPPPPPPPPPPSSTTDTGVPAPTSTSNSSTTNVSCPPPVSTASTTASRMTTNSSPVPSQTGSAGAPFLGKGHLVVFQGGKSTGCLISNGKWMVGATCATFKGAAMGSGSQLMSRKGPCGLVGGTISCDSGVAPSEFDNSSNNLAVGGVSTFSASSIPSGTTQIDLGTSSASTGVTISWVGA